MKSILIIEDNIDIRENTAEILNLAGYKTFIAVNGKKGVEMATQVKPDVIICDIMMPELDGFGVLHLIRMNEDTRQIPFIFLTAKTERSDFRKGMEMGADDYITKPFDDIELLHAVEIRLKKNDILQKQYASSPHGLNNFIDDLKGTGFMKHLASEYETENFSKKQVVYQEGKRPRYLYCIVTGKVKGFKIHPDGKEYITDLYSDGDFIGYPALIKDEPYDDNATAIEDADMILIPRAEFQQMIFRDINIAAKFIRIITQNVKEKEERLLNMAYSSLRKRVASALAELYIKYESETVVKTNIEISREDLAHYIGTATESLIRTLSDFKSNNLIEIKEGKICITDIDKLKNLLY
jgi:CRP-like cAMP-binding protein/FixJ family two-component response regulator